MSQDVRHRTSAPLLIRIAGVFAGFWAALVCVILLGLIAMIVLDAGSLEFNGRPVSRDEFARQFPTIVAALGVPAIYLGAVAVGVWRERAWVRPAVLAFWILISLGLVVQAVLGILDVVLACGPDSRESPRRHFRR